MNFEKLNKEATERAEKALQTGFDVQAYTVITLNEIVARMGKYGHEETAIYKAGAAKASTTNAHDGSCTMHDCYNAYSDKKTTYRRGECSSGDLTDLLHESLKTSRKIIAEMYANCDIVEEQNAIKAFVESLNKLVK